MYVYIYILIFTNININININNPIDFYVISHDFPMISLGNFEMRPPRPTAGPTPVAARLGCAGAQRPEKASGG